MDVQPLAVGQIWLTNVIQCLLSNSLFPGSPSGTICHTTYLTFRVLKCHIHDQKRCLQHHRMRTFSHMPSWKQHCVWYCASQYMCIAFWCLSAFDQNRYSYSHGTGGRRIYGSALFSEHTIGISLYSKDWVELEQLGNRQKSSGESTQLWS